MEMEWVILGQIVAFLVVSSGTIFAVSAPKFDEETTRNGFSLPQNCPILAITPTKVGVRLIKLANGRTGAWKWNG